MTKPRYALEQAGQGWIVRDREAALGAQVLAVMASQEAARAAVEALNRGLCEAIAPDGRWTEPEDKP